MTRAGDAAMTPRAVLALLSTKTTTSDVMGTHNVAYDASSMSERMNCQGSRGVFGRTIQDGPAIFAS
jgi:hypothetical protein